MGLLQNMVQTFGERLPRYFRESSMFAASDIFEIKDVNTLYSELLKIQLRLWYGKVDMETSDFEEKDLMVRAWLIAIKRLQQIVDTAPFITEHRTVHAHILSPFIHHAARVSNAGADTTQILLNIASEVFKLPYVKLQLSEEENLEGRRYITNAKEILKSIQEG